MTAATQTCDCCNGESGGTFVGVASVPGAAVTIAWCDRCLKENATPFFAAEYFVLMVDGHIEELIEDVHQQTVWRDGRYMPFPEFAATVTPERIRQFWKDYAEAWHASPPIDDALLNADVDPNVEPPAATGETEEP